MKGAGQDDSEPLKEMKGGTGNRLALERTLRLDKNYSKGKKKLDQEEGIGNGGRRNRSNKELA